MSKSSDFQTNYLKNNDLLLNVGENCLLYTGGSQMVGRGPQVGRGGIDLGRRVILRYSSKWAVA